MTKAIRIFKTGGPDVMEYVDVEVGEPGPGEPLLGAADIQSLADLANSFAVADGMRIIPITRTAFLIFVASAAAPLLPLTLTVMPADKLVDTLAQVLL